MDSKKVKIFEIWTLEIYERVGGGCPGSTMNCVLTCILIISNFHSVSELWVSNILFLSLIFDLLNVL